MLLQIVCGVNGESNDGCIKSSQGTTLPTQNLMILDEMQLVNELHATFQTLQYNFFYTHLILICKLNFMV
jgi:hypothetical protein